MRKQDLSFVNINAEVEEKITDISINYKYAKRTVDFVGALVGIIIMLLVLSVFVFVYSTGKNRGSMIFKQKRIGQNGEFFEIYKFRSMIEDAEEVLKQDEKLYKKYIANSYKLEPEEDPRITSFGRFIRKTSLDELPQFINVLKGEMSLVGPRPIVQAELEEYHGKKDTFLSAKPGITGYWQTCGRSDVNYPERVDIELYYMYNQSLWLDFKILFKTVGQVVLRKGAY